VARSSSRVLGRFAEFGSGGRIFGALLVVKEMKASYEVRIGNLMNEGEAKELIR